MQRVGVIPARWKSRRFPGKPLADILGKSLVQRTYEQAAQSQLLDALVVATDDHRILDHVHSFGGKAFMTSESCPTGTDRTAEVIGSHFPEAEIVVNLQGDEPLLDPRVIDTLIEKLEATPDALLTTPVTRILDREEVANPSIVKCVFDSFGRALYFSRAPIPYSHFQKEMPDAYRHIGVYCFRREFLFTYQTLLEGPLQRAEDLEQLKILEMGKPIHVCLVEEGGVGVDTPEELKKVEEILCKENISSSQVVSSPL
ncbi:MAG: 3-deoxy-manno-octulosonate cytidylyltransferase [Chlamydiae bacterium]|nr:3-deoxy-manno-octulosonate cytidylyltransferase [Chlamydiota bacterium]